MEFHSCLTHMHNFWKFNATIYQFRGSPHFYSVFGILPSKKVALCFDHVFPFLSLANGLSSRSLAEASLLSVVAVCASPLEDVRFDEWAKIIARCIFLFSEAY